MKKSLFALLTILSLLSFQAPTVNATPFYGAELSYTYLGGNDYLVDLTFYRDCSAIWAPANVPVTFSCSANPLYNFSVTMYPIAWTGFEVTGTCPYQSSHCSGGSLAGYQKHEYQAQVQLPPCGAWTLSYDMCCRPVSNTIQNPVSQSARITATLDNSSGQANSSPVFTNDPLLVMCAGQTTCYNPGALDPDGDSLAYSLVAPMTSISGTVTYLAPYSATQPVPSNPPVSIDHSTGELCMSPVPTIISLMAIRVEEWRSINGAMTLVGTSIRDFTFDVVACNTSVPTLSGIDESLSTVYDPSDNLYSADVCLGSGIAFTIKGHDADTFNPFNTGSPETFHISWNQGIPGGNFTVYHNDTDSAYAQFIWTPTSLDLSRRLHCFTATVSDSACPYNLRQSFAYCFRVRQPDTIRITGPDTLCANHSATLTADPGFASYLWSTGDTTMSIQVDGSILGPGLHSFTVTGDDGICQSSAGHSLWVDPCTGIGSSEAHRTFTVFPNPSQGSVDVLLEGYRGRCAIEVLDIQGRQVYSESFLPGVGNCTLRIASGTLSPGTYLVRLLSDDGNEQRLLTVR